MGFYVCLISIFNCKKLTKQECDLEKMQLELFEIIRGWGRKKKNYPENAIQTVFFKQFHFSRMTVILNHELNIFYMIIHEKKI